MRAAVRLSATAARFVGDDYQIVVALQWAVLATRPDSDIVTIELESREVPRGLDDVVVRRRSAPDVLIQAKGSVSAAHILSTDDLCTPARPKAPSLLQQLYAGWQQLNAAGRVAEVRLATTRSLDPGDLLLATRDHHGRVNLARIEPGSLADQLRTRWQQHLACTKEELVAFLAALRIDTDSSLDRAREQLAHYLQLSGYRSDAAALDELIGIARGWITDGRGRLTPEEIDAAFAARGLRVAAPMPLVQIHGIDPQIDEVLPAAGVTLDWRAHYLGQTPAERVAARQPSCLTDMTRDLEDLVSTMRKRSAQSIAFRGALHLPQWFAIGAAFRKVSHAHVELIRSDGRWASGQRLVAVPTTLPRRRDIGAGHELAIALEISGAIEEEVAIYVHGAAVPAQRLVTLAKVSTIERIGTAAEAESIAVVMRDAIRAACVAEGADRVHLFMHAPDFVALLLGHHWDRLAVQTYAWLGTGKGYVPSLFIAG